MGAQGDLARRILIQQARHLRRQPGESAELTEEVIEELVRQGCA